MAVNGGTLGGNGIILGPVTVAAGAILAPGASIGVLSISNTLTLASGSFTVMELNKTTLTNDSVVGVTTLTYGGTLLLNNLSGTLAAGDTFNLFAAAAYTGAFSRIVTRSLGQTVTWDTSRLAVDGTIKAATVGPVPITTSYNSANATLSLSWPLSQTGLALQTQTNTLAVGLSTNWVAIPGSTATNLMIIPVDRANPAVFFRLTPQ